jgi:hypothetical protein
MEKLKVILQTLATNSSKRPTAALFRELLPWIEAARNAGVTHTTIWETLSAEGLHLTIGTYRTLLHRSRKKVRTPKPNTEPNHRPKQQPELPTQPTFTRSKAVGEPESFDWNQLKKETPSW